MNKKSGLILRTILGGYLVFLGVSVLSQAIQTQPADLVMKSLFGVLFIVVGGYYALLHIKRMYELVKKETEENGDEGMNDSTQPLYAKPQHDQSLYRTAPMQADEIRKKIPAQATDLRANMNPLPEKQQEQALQTVDVHKKEERGAQGIDAYKTQVIQTEVNKVESAKTQVIQIEPNKAESAKLQTNLKTEQEKKQADLQDPVRLAIEIIQNEDNEE